MDEAQVELERLLEDEDLKDISLLVFANKCDLPNALSAKVGIFRAEISLHHHDSRNLLYIVGNLNTAEATVDDKELSQMARSILMCYHW